MLCKNNWNRLNQHSAIWRGNGFNPRCWFSSPNATYKLFGHRITWNFLIYYNYLGDCGTHSILQRGGWSAGKEAFTIHIDFSKVLIYLLGLPVVLLLVDGVGLFYIVICLALFAVISFFTAYSQQSESLYRYVTIIWIN